MSDNPYQSPQTGAAPVPAASGILTETMVLSLKGASPWLRFLGIMGFIGCGILAAAGIVMMIAGSSFIPGMDELGSFTAAALGVLYIILGVVGFFPARFTYCFGARIRGFLRNSAEQELELAFKYNKSFWKFSGIVTIIYLAIIPVVIVIGVIVAVSSASF
jgi:hypothetical protein